MADRQAFKVGRYRAVYEPMCLKEALTHDAVRPGSCDRLAASWRCENCNALVTMYGHGESGLVLFAQDWFIVRDAQTNEKHLIVLEPHQINILREMTQRVKEQADPHPEKEGGGYVYGSFKYRFWVYSCPKKSGKSAIGGLIGAWAGVTFGSFNEIYFAANSRDQATTRAFAVASQIFMTARELRKKYKAQMLKNEIRLDATHTTIKAASSDWGSMAGVNPGMVVWDELWAFNTEEDERLWQELAPSPARRDSVTVVVTYAGFENESTLLHDLYLKGVGKEEHLKGKGAKFWADLPVYTNGPMFVYWDHTPRMSWHSKKWLQDERMRTSPAAWLRQYENRWTSPISAFIAPEQYDACENPGLAPLTPHPERELRVGVDLGWKHDNAAVVAVWRDPATGHPRLARYQIWRPPDGGILNIEQTVEAFILELHRGYRIRGVWYDPAQMVRSAQTLADKGIKMIELPQTEANMTAATSALYWAFVRQTLELYPAPDLREHVLTAVTAESARGVRLQKDKQSAKIDGCVALAFALHGFEAPIEDDFSFG
jgi:phage terminase large subunit-like protein